MQPPPMDVTLNVTDSAVESVAEEEQEDPPAGPNDMLLRVITLNCWGLRFVSRHKTQRIKAIAQHLKEQDYDIVFLQELWCQSDFDNIRTTTGYTFSHYFKSSSLIGSSGLAIFCKFPPESIHFEPYTVNGSPFFPHHGDWFAGKGAAYVRVDLQGIRLHLFCTHMHAQYDNREQIGDMYSIHRLCQSYQLAKFINLVAQSTLSKDRTGSDLILVAGDFNTNPDQLPFKLLMSMTGLEDCFKNDHPDQMDGDQIISENDLITCGHHLNSYSSSDQKCPEKHGGQNIHGSRIDFILYKLVHKCACKSSDCVCPHFQCKGNRLDCIGKDPQSGLSFSDHQPVTLRLVIKKQLRRRTARGIEASRSSTYSSSFEERRGPNGALSLAGKDRDPFGESQFNGLDAGSSKRTIHHIDSFQEDVLEGEGSLSQGNSTFTGEKSVLIRNGSSLIDVPSDSGFEGDKGFSNPSNVLLDMMPSSSSFTGRKGIKMVSGQEEDFNPYHPQNVSISSLTSPCVKHLDSTNRLLGNYLKEDMLKKQRIFLYIIFISLILIAISVGLGIVFDSVSYGLFPCSLVVFLFAVLLMAGMELTNRFERTAIKGISEELATILIYAPNASNE